MNYLYLYILKGILEEEEAFTIKLVTMLSTSMNSRDTSLTI